MEVCKPEKCTGCGLCYSICKKNAISMIYDSLGCIRPFVDTEKCINCGICRKKCPSNNTPKARIPSKYYAVQSRDDETLFGASSGGVFPVLATIFIRDGGIVYGAAWKKNNENSIEGANCKRITSLEEISELQNSKYLQIESHNSYLNLIDDLKSSRRVLFTGTPCQIAAVNQFVPEALKENLYTLDVVCHGVCGQKLFMDFYHVFSEHKNIKNFVFRSKDNGWGLAARIDFEKNGKLRQKIYPCRVLSYYQIFLKGHMYRESCYSCMYARRERVSDITAGDFWGVQEEHPDFARVIDIRKGCSFISLNTEKGQKMFEMAADNMICYPTSYESVSRHNGQLVNPSKIGKYRNDYIELYTKYGYDSVEKYFIRNERDKKSYWYYLIKSVLNNVKSIVLVKK